MVDTPAKICPKMGEVLPNKERSDDRKREAMHKMQTVQTNKPVQAKTIPCTKPSGSTQSQHYHQLYRRLKAMQRLSAQTQTAKQAVHQRTQNTPDQQRHTPCDRRTIARKKARGHQHGEKQSNERNMAKA